MLKYTVLNISNFAAAVSGTTWCLKTIATFYATTPTPSEVYFKNLFYFIFITFIIFMIPLDFFEIFRSTSQYRYFGHLWEHTKALTRLVFKCHNKYCETRCQKILDGVFEQMTS